MDHRPEPVSSTAGAKRRRRTRRVLAAIVTVAAVALVSCGNHGKPVFTDTPTSGEITIACDESYEPIMQVETDTFMGLYKYAKVHVQYLPETQTFNALLNNDSIRCAVVSRELNDKEKAYFEQRKLIPRTVKIAVDAVALVVNNANADTALRYEALGEILSGRQTRWKSQPGDSIRIVFDRNGSSNTRFLQEKFLHGSPFPPNAYALESNASVIDYVSQTRNALGIVSVNWISDRDDPTVNEFLRKIKVVAISPPDTSADAGSYYKPYQAYVYLKQYPLIRDVFVINREGRNGLGTGFASFVAGDQGQRLIKLMGMLPATMPVRLIQIN
jgi:phosphate transport system substrate-binding protein